MSSGAIVTFNDPRRFGFMKLVPRHKLDDEPLLARLGPSRSATPSTPRCWRRLPGKKTSLKAALLDQRVVAGLGNIYVCEALYRARLSPKRSGLDHRQKTGAPNERAERLVDGIKAVLNDAIRPAARRCAITSRPTANSAISSIISASTTARAKRASRRVARHRSSASCRTGARRFIARYARSDDLFFLSP